MEAANEAVLVEYFRRSTDGMFAANGAYSHVRVLLITWSESDLSGTEKEVGALYTLLKTKFHYEIESFKIPSDETAANRLHLEIIERGKQAVTGTLLIVYYAGHCDKDDRGNALWAATSKKDSPTLSWHVIQQALFLVRGDVLLLLDCCNASLIATGSKEIGKFEMIAACGKNNVTVKPSNESFTRILMHELKPHAEKGIRADKLAFKIMENPRFSETPVFHDFVPKNCLHILLQCLPEALAAPGFGQKPSSYIVFLASLSDDVPGQQIADWLIAGAPQQVIGVDIEALLLRARRMQGLEDDDVFAPGSFLGKLSQVARSEIVQSLRGLHTTMDQAYQHAVGPQADQPSETAQQSIQDIQKSLTAVHESIETPILQDLGDLDQDAAKSDPFVQNTEASYFIDLRRAVLRESAQGDIEISHAGVKFKRGQASRHVGTIGTKRVVLETFSYTVNPDGGAPYPATMKQVKHISGLLAAVKQQQNFRILPFRGFFHNRVRHEFDLYKKHEMVPLGHRVYLIHALCVAMEYFHRVGWVHKGIRSANIAFDSITGDEGSSSQPTQGTTARIGCFDLAQPYLFGFEYARADDQGTNREEDYTPQNNMYRHPDRWGHPRVDYTKAHDVYALGIVMLEVALWRDIESICKTSGQRPGNMKTSYVYERAKKKCQGEVGHRVGDVLAQAIVTCLDFAELTKDLSEFESQRYFQHRVKSRAGQMVGKV
ncbi:hypothetical protein GGR52DRAFT_589303 [Hypoxylon sp. FL1284]|nr:hypothetical protein GGR52DRAFT_589303 [Hypoxylon sp. FL1284]